MYTASTAVASLRDLAGTRLIRKGFVTFAMRGALNSVQWCL
jgi:hypothetical protein